MLGAVMTAAQEDAQCSGYREEGSGRRYVPNWLLNLVVVTTIYLIK